MSKLLIIGQGGREHALVQHFLQSPFVKQIFVAPGHVAMCQHDRVSCVDISVTDVQGLLSFARTEKIDLTVVGPEAALAEAIVDVFQQQGLSCFGPSQQAAQLETSKAYAKDFLHKYNIATARSWTCHTEQDAEAAWSALQAPYVIKADGLAAGKGVVICENQQTARQTVLSMLTEKKGATSASCVVVEEFLPGHELSYIVLVQNDKFVALASAQDHKKRDAGDKGPNTGGMGVLCPAPAMTDALQKIIEQDIVRPVLAGIKKEGMVYQGFLYFGLMIINGKPHVLEFNCRLGDPEAQAILPRLKTDLWRICQAICEQHWQPQPLQWDPRVAVNVVLAAEGYPISPVAKVLLQPSALKAPLFVYYGCVHAQGRQWQNNGGRILSVTALATDFSSARDLVYGQLQQWDNLPVFYREDIGNNVKYTADIST